jgi:hypothetical protein
MLQLLDNILERPVREANHTTLPNTEVRDVVSHTRRSFLHIVQIYKTISWFRELVAGIFTMQTRLRFPTCPYCGRIGTGTGFSTNIYRLFEGPYCLRHQGHAVVMSTQEGRLNILLNASTNQLAWCNMTENFNLQIGYSKSLSTHNATTRVSVKGPYKIHLVAATTKLYRKLKCLTEELPQ